LDWASCGSPPMTPGELKESIHMLAILVCTCAVLWAVYTGPQKNHHWP
jgi:hypothetical protein